MKIKEIKINGIRGFNYFDDTEDAPHIIRANGANHLFIYGENGTGKSSFFDALEWCFTGDLFHEIQKRQTDKSFIFNQYNKNNDSPYVSIEFDNSDTVTRKKENTRTNLTDTNCILTEDWSPCFIEANRIERFVTDRKDNLWKNFSELLGLDVLLNFEKKLKKLFDKAEKEYCDKKKINEEHFAEIVKIKSEIDELGESFKKEFGDGWDKTILSIDIEKARKYYLLQKTIDEFSQAYDTNNQIQLKLSKAKEELTEISKKTIEQSLIPVINEATNYFQSKESVAECPVCNNKIDFDTIKQKLTASKEELKGYNEKKQEIVTLESQVSKRLTRKEINADTQNRPPHS